MYAWIRECIWWFLSLLDFEKLGPLFDWKLGYKTWREKVMCDEATIRKKCRMRCGLSSLILLAVMALPAAEAQVATNEALYRQFRDWEKAIRAGEAKGVAEEIEARATGMASLETPVLSGTDWSYNWGYMTALTKAWAEQCGGKSVAAYRTLKNVEGFRPSVSPPAPQDYHYWQWFLSVGDACLDMTRLQDAEWYFRQARSGVSTNDGHYWKATVSLAATLNRQGRLEEAEALYDEIIWNRPDQPPGVWKEYVEFLFDSGYFEEGAEALLIGAELKKLAGRGRTDDFFASSVRQYWHYLSDEQIVRWYNLLGGWLDQTVLARDTEDFLAFLINTRRIIEKVYPELVGQGKNDLAVLKDRAAVDPLPKKIWPKCQSEKTSKADKAVVSSAGELCAPPVAVRPVQLTIEDDVNRALLRVLESRRRGYLPDEPWKKLLAANSTNDLHEVVVDGMSALFHVYAGLGASFSYSSKPVEAKGWLLKALEEAKATSGFNAMRMGDVLICLGDVYLNSWVQEPNEAARYLEWGRTMVRGYRKQEYLVKAGLAGVALMSGEDEGVERRIPLLQAILDQYGCLPRRGIYERLARDYYRTSRTHEGFAVNVEGFKRSRLVDSDTDHLVEGLTLTRSLHSASELTRLRGLFRAGALRFSAKVERAAAIARMLDLSEAAWIGEHEELARLEESGTFASDEGMGVITNALVQHPSVRAGRLHARAALERSVIARESPDWSGWLMAWQLIKSEFRSREPQAPADTGGDVAAREMLLDLFIPNMPRLTDEDFMASSEAIRSDADALTREQLMDVGEALAAESPEEAFRLHLAAMTRRRNTSVDNPSFQALFALLPDVPMELRQELVDLLRQKQRQASDLELKRTWEQAIRTCGVGL